MDITEMDVSEFLEKEELQEHTAKLAANAEAFLASCGKLPLEIYRIEKFVPTLQDVKSHGKFYSGDSYVILKQNDDDYQIHYWHGEECTTDEMGSSAAFSTQLSSKLPKESSHNLELQFNESDLFSSYFKDGIEYLKGGIESGFNYVDEPVIEPKLLRCKGTTNARVFEVEMKADSINEGDIFILETADKIYYWKGDQANNAEQGKAFGYVQSMRRYERHCKSDIFYPKEDAEIDAEFWGFLGGKPAKINPAKPDDVPEDDAYLKYSFWQIKQEGTKVNLTEIKDRPLTKAMLDPTNVYILETHKKVSIWIGGEADLDEKKNSLIIGKGFVKAHNKPKNTRVMRIPQNCEDQMFKSYFTGFMEQAHLKLGDEDKYKTDVAAIAKKKRTFVDSLLTKLGKYTVHVYLCKDGNNVEIPEDSYGHFFDQEVYAIDIQGENHRYVIQWIGPDLASDEHAKLREYLAKLTDYVYSPRSVTRLTVQQGHEDDTLLKFFPNGFVIHQGNHMAMDALYARIKEKGGMWRVQGPFGETPQAIQNSDMECQNLNSNEAFFVVKNDGSHKAFAWSGIGASDGERLYVARLEKILNVASCDHINETEESDEFWAAVGGKTEYSSTKTLGFAPGFEPRMFQITVSMGYNTMTEVKNFRQSDLENNDVMIIDAYNTIWVWQGRKSSVPERKNATKNIETYKANITDGRDPKKIQIVTIDPCNEPFTFTGLFPDWDDDYLVNWMEPAEVKAEKGPTAEEVKESEVKNDSGKTFSLDELKAGCPEGVHPAAKQNWLNDADFKAVFNMSREEFAGQKEWKQKKLKQAAGLF